MTRKYTKNAYQIILDSALEVFSEFGYDGARIDEVAKRAKVPKSLIYYHFEGKEHLLRELVNGFVEDVKEVILRGEGIDELIESFSRAFLEEKSQLIRIILIESLKNNDKLPSIYSTLEQFIQYETQVLKREHANVTKRLVSEFFINFIPRSMFVCMKDSFSEYFHIPKDELNNIFYKSMVEMHEAYLNKLFERK